MHQQIILRDLDKPRRKNLESDLFWICDSFGLRAGRDLEQLSSRIVMQLLKRFAESERAVSTEILADDLTISPARVNHHLRNLMETGFLYREKRLIFLRGGSMKNAVNELRNDASKIFDELEEIAQEIDLQMGLEYR